MLDLTVISRTDARTKTNMHVGDFLIPLRTNRGKARCQPRPMGFCDLESELASFTAAAKGREANEGLSKRGGQRAGFLLGLP